VVLAGAGVLVAGDGDTAGAGLVSGAALPADIGGLRGLRACFLRTGGAVVTRGVIVTRR